MMPDFSFQNLMTPQQVFDRNQPYVAPGQTTFDTKLAPMDEFSFRQWVQDNNVPFNPDGQRQDYDMRGYWQGLQQQNPRAISGMNANDGRLHFSDNWKTPYHQSFSNESKYANQSAPRWINDSQLASPSGRILYDERGN